MSFTVRPEVAKDVEGIRKVHIAAFPTAAEADLVERLRDDHDSEISLVAEQAGWIVGHVLLSRMQVGGDGVPIFALGLAPVAVLPEQQRTGIGSMLIRGALALAREAEEEMIFVLGDTDYYGRFGFSAAIAAPFASPYAGPYLMALALNDMVMPASGQAAYAPAFARLGDS